MCILTICNKCFYLFVLGALALRNFDKDRQGHFRIERGHEPPMFLHLLNGKMIVSGNLI